MLRAEGVWPEYAAELAAWPEATFELVTKIIDRCAGEIRKRPSCGKVINPGGYIATAVANAVEPESVRAVREAKSAGQGPSSTRRAVAIAKLREVQIPVDQESCPRETAMIAVLNASPPRKVCGFQVGKGAGFAVACKGDVLIFESGRKYSRDGADALFNFDRLGERDLAKLAGVLAIVPSSKFLPIADSAVG